MIDETQGDLTRLHTVGGVVNPSYLAFDPQHRFLFAVNETQEYEGRPTGAVSSFAIDQQSGGLTFLSKQPSEGGDPCHLCTDPTGRFLFVANHEDGTVGVFPIGEDGRLGPASDVQRHAGSGPGPTLIHSRRRDCKVERLAHVPEKWAPVFRIGHAPTQEN